MKGAIKKFKRCCISDDVPEEQRSFGELLESFLNKKKWTKRWKELTSAMLKPHQASFVSDQIFECLQAFFSGQSSIDDLYELDVHFQRELDFYIPQFCAVFLHYSNARLIAELEGFFLYKAARNIVFAHKLLWNIMAQLKDGDEINTKTWAFL